MITWIQKYFQHHFKGVFAVLLGVLIVAFVFTIGAGGGTSSSDRLSVPRPFFGYNLNLQSDVQKISREAEISVGLRYGSMMMFQIGAEQLQMFAFNRTAMLHLADQWHIPPATEEELKKQISGLREFAGQDGKFDQAAYSRYRDRLKASPRTSGLTEADVLRVISDDVRAEKVQKLLVGPGYVQPFEIKNYLNDQDTLWTIATATADYTAFKPEIKPTDAELAQFFEQSGSRYDTPPRVAVSYLEFPALPLVADIKVTDEEVRKFYDQNPARFPKPADAAKAAQPAAPAITPAIDSSADFAAVRAQVESELKLDRARKLAAKAASDTQLALHNAGAKTPAAIEAFLAERKLTLKALPPFAREAAPLELSGSPQIAAEAFSLNKDRLISDPLATPTGAVLLYWRESLPSTKPLLQNVRDAVTADYIESERRKRFIEAGRAVKAQLEARLKAGDTMEQAVAAASGAGLKLEAKAFEPFSARTRAQGVDQTILGALGRLEKGRLSDMVSAADKGVFVYALEKKAPDTSEANPLYVDARTQFADDFGSFAGNAYLRELVEQELKRSEPKGQ
ncbi:MAG: peptidyl-prolyl cis-trans isomerase [Opitutaceae bacterium]|nr:peptidyl-prolyl cis-trans isomerase [Opitutaceae bacterium]